jgi:hypothetical protein
MSPLAVYGRAIPIGRLSRFKRKLRGEWLMDQSELFAHVLTVLEDLEIRYAVVGSVASIFYSESRFTHDLDVVIDIDPAKVQALCAAFPENDFYVSQAAAEDAVRRKRQFNVIHPRSGHKIDFMIERSGTWGKMQLTRRRRVELYSGQHAYIAAPEDVILGKLLYYREGESPKHLRDICGMLQVSGHEIDRDDVAKWAAELGVSDIWQAILTRLKDAEAENS